MQNSIDYFYRNIERYSLYGLHVIANTFCA